MTIREAAAKLQAEIIQNDFEDAQLEGAYTSDLLSDVMAHAKDGGALITIQAHKNTVAVATLVNLSVVIVCNNRPIPDDMIEAARDEGVAILRTKENQYIVSGKLYAMIGVSKD
jgi:hypothetical protein